MQPENYNFVVEPDLKDECALIWKSQILIPSIGSHAFLGPLPKSRKDNDEFKPFSLATTNTLLGFLRKDLMLWISWKVECLGWPHIIIMKLTTIG